MLARLTPRLAKQLLISGAFLVVQVVEGIEGAALAAAVDALVVTQQNAERAGIAGPPQGWPAWLSALTQAAQARPDPSSATHTPGQPSSLLWISYKTGLD